MTDYKDKLYLLKTLRDMVKKTLSDGDINEAFEQDVAEFFIELKNKRNVRKNKRILRELDNWIKEMDVKSEKFLYKT